MAQELGDQDRVAAALSGLGRIARENGDLARAAALFNESLTDFQGARMKVAYGGIAQELINLADLAHAQGDEKTTRALLEESTGVRCPRMKRASLFLSVCSRGICSWTG